MATDAEIAAAALAALKASPGVKSVTTAADGTTTVVYKDNTDVIEAVQFAEQRVRTAPASNPVRRVAVAPTSGIC